MCQPIDDDCFGVTTASSDAPADPQDLLPGVWEVRAGGVHYYRSGPSSYCVRCPEGDHVPATHGYFCASHDAALVPHSPAAEVIAAANARYVAFKGSAS